MSRSHENLNRRVQWSVGLTVLLVAGIGLTGWSVWRAGNAPNPAPPNREIPTPPEDLVADFGGGDERVGFLRLMNLAKAYLEAANYAKAIETLTPVIRFKPS